MQIPPSLRLISRLSTTSTRCFVRQIHHQHQHQHHQSPPSFTSTSAIAYTTAAVAATATATTLSFYNPLIASSDAAPSPSPPPPSSISDISSSSNTDTDKTSDETEGKNSDQPTHDWTSVIAALREVQRTEALGAGFRAARRPLPLPASGYAHDVEFNLRRGADVNNVVTSIARALNGVWLHVEDSGTRIDLILQRSHLDKSFQVSVCIPRVMTTPSFDGRVSIHLQKGPKDLFSENEIHALVDAYRSSLQQQQQDGKTDSHILDGKLSVDIGPPTHHRSKKPPKTKSDSRFILKNKDPIIHDDEDNDDHDHDEHDDKMNIESRKMARAKLEELGVEVFEKENGLTWDALAGYEEVKERIEDTLTLPLRHPEVYERIVKGTRKRAEPNVPKAVLYEGPPGCGKTLSARILAATIGVPFVHVRVETLLSKFYGETTRKMSEVLEAANALGRCIVFLDECDSVGLKRSGTSEVHEVTRRTLSVLLRFIDGMDGARDAIILAATNHKEDLDAALLSRFDVVVSFPLPNRNTRIAMLRLYAKQLDEKDVDNIAQLTWGFSGRELLDICEEAERTRAGVIVRQRKDDEEFENHDEYDGLPTLQDYVDAVHRKAPHIVGRHNERFVDANVLQELMRDVGKSGNEGEREGEREQTTAEKVSISTAS